jgi:uncharacterized phage protein (TIGR01671 family)
MEYMFRGVDAVGKKRWVYGDLVHNKKITETGLEDRVMVGGYEVVPESVGLWTGLKDKHGKRVFEGDIVECVSWNEYFSKDGQPMEPFRRKMYVDFRKGGFRMVEPMPKPMKDNEWDIIYNGDIEVIGNVFDDKNILER